MSTLIASFWRLSSLAACLLLLSNPAISEANAIETSAVAAILLDAKTGTILFEKNADGPMPPSSMSKMMTAYLVFQRLQDGRLSLNDELLVSKYAWRKGGSKMFVKVGKKISIEDLLRGIIVQSGNDASIVVAEGLAGSEEAFADEMNEEGKKLGLKNSLFKNSTGWPAEGQSVSTRDLSIVALRTIQDFPEYYHYYAEKEFTYGGIRQTNRNPLLYGMKGADGLKTGHTQASGYGLAASAERDGRRLVLVLNGLPNERARTQESRRLLEWGFREFGNYELFKASQEVDKVRVWLGTENTVQLVIEEDFVLTLPKKNRKEMQVSLLYNEPIPAPIVEGTEVAKIIVKISDANVAEIPLVAGKSVERLGFFGRMEAAMGYLLWGVSH